MALLKSWLTPSQREQYEREYAFEVIGSRGTRYRIENGTSGNVKKLDRKGNRVSSWCFAPSGGLVMGDVMLAQKIALETDEDAAAMVANKTPIRSAPLYRVVDQLPPSRRAGFFERLFR